MSGRSRGRRLSLNVLRLVVAVAVLVPGISAAYEYGKDYWQHRGFATLVHLKRAGRGRLVVVDTFSHALGRRADYLVYLPPHYDPLHRYPTFYLLHGMPGQPRVFVDIANMDVRLDNQLALGHLGPMILVYPDGRINGDVFSDSEWANTPSGAFESWVLEVMHDVDHRFSTARHSRDRVIGGFSAGAYGALNIALHHPHDFGSVESWSGYFTQSATGVFQNASQAVLDYNSPLTYTLTHRREISRRPLRVFLSVGRLDHASRELYAMVDALHADGVAVHAAIYGGGHDWAVWYPQLNSMLRLAWRDTTRPLSLRGPLIAVHYSRHRRAAHRVRGGHGLHAAHTPLAARTPLPIRTLQPARAHHAVAARAHAHPSAPLVTVAPGPARAAHAAYAAPSRPSRLRLLAALLLALLSGALINLGFVLQHRGHSDVAGSGRARLAGVLRNRSWLVGQAIGWLGFAGQILAVAFSPLTLVQAFFAGSLALSVPLAARLVGQRLRAAQLGPVVLIAVGLASLTIGHVRAHGPLHAGLLAAIALAGLGVGGRLAWSGSVVARALIAGVLYGIGDAVIKATALGVRAHGVSALLSGWTVLAALCTFGGFLAFQAALRDRDAVRPIVLMNALTAVAAVLLGLLAFGESLGGTSASVGLHIVAIAVVLACAVPLIRLQEGLVATPDQQPAVPPQSPALMPAPAPVPAPGWLKLRSPVPRPSRLAQGAGALVTGSAMALRVLALLAAAVAGTGWLYQLRSSQSLSFGPRVSDSLPLLQLAGFDGQPLARVLAAFLLAGGALWLAYGVLRRDPARSSSRRLIAPPVIGAAVAIALVLIVSDASYALARNTRLSDALLNRSLPLGPWLEGLLLATAVLLPARLRLPGRRRQDQPVQARPHVPAAAQPPVPATARPHPPIRDLHEQPLGL